MRINIKNLGVALAMGLSLTACNDQLDMEPISQITPDSYYQNADQIAAYLNNYYTSYLTGPYSGMAHATSSYTDGMGSSDANTDIFMSGISGSTSLFADGHWLVGTDNVLESAYYPVRVMNFIINNVEGKLEDGTLSHNDADVMSYLGEAYFLRALVYFNMLVKYGDLPIVTEVLRNSDDAILPASERKPRTEVADFILSDLDKAISTLKDRSAFRGQRINKQAAQVLKSRVALFEATFEKYHKGTGRVPGDDTWPGKSMSFNSGKTFDIDGHVKSLLTQAMEASKAVADDAVLTQNNHQLDPALQYDLDSKGNYQYDSNGNLSVSCSDYLSFNPYFNMYSTPSLYDNEEVLLWREYSADKSLKHDVPYRILKGNHDGFTRNFAQSFLCKNGLPIYATSDYKGDKSLDNVVANRDERLQLFVWADSRLMGADQADPNRGYLFGGDGDDELGSGYPNIVGNTAEVRCITGYQPRKYYTYDYAQLPNDQMNGTNACPMMRSAEALLNYIEAEVELNGQLDANALKYWQRLRERAGVSTDIQATVDATDLDKEYDNGDGDHAVYSGTEKVSKLLYNVRRERMNETFCEGFRRMDLNRWRSWDNMLSTKWLPKGMNFWDAQYKRTKAWWEGYWSEGKVIADGSGSATVSSKDISKYLCPWSRQSTNNELYEGCNWHKAYYLYPLGTEDMITASPDRTLANSMMYQNPYWPSNAGSATE